MAHSFESPPDTQIGFPDEQGKPSSILKNRNFMFLWGAQAISMTAQQAIWFAMIIVVETVSHSTTQTSIAVMSTLIPAVLLGLLAGVFVDRVDKKAVLVTTNLLRAVTVLGYLLYPVSLWIVYTVNFVFVAISQFFGPAEAATIPALVTKRQLVAANSAFNITFTASQLIGIVVLAPWIIKLFGAEALFIFTAVLYLAAAGLSYLLPKGQTPTRSLSTLKRATLLRDINRDLSETIAFIRSDSQTFWAMIITTLMSCLMLILGTLAPRYVVAALDIRAEDAVYVLAPAFLGIVVVTSILSRLTSRFGKAIIVNLGMVIGGFSVFGMGMLVRAEAIILPGVWAILGSLIHLPFRHGLVPPLMIITFLMGVGYAMASVPSQSVLMERAPVESRARVYSILLLLTNAASILPLLFLGTLADLVGINETIALVGLLVIIVSGFSIRGYRRSLRSQVA